MTGWLAGALVDRVDHPAPGLFAITLTAPHRRATLVTAVFRGALRWALLPDRPRGDAADAGTRGLREKLEGGRIVRAWDHRGALGLHVRRGDIEMWVTATREGLAVHPPIEGARPEGDVVDEAAIARAEGRAPSFLAELAAASLDVARTQARAALRKARDRLTRRVAAIENDRLAVAAAESASERATLFVVAAKRAPRGATELVATDWATGAPVTFPLDPSKPGPAQIEAVFARAKRLRAGMRIADARRDEAELAILVLDDADEAIAAATTDAEVTAIVTRVARELPPGVRLDPPRPPGRRERAPERLPYKSYRASNGAAIFVGRSAADNDALTTTIAKPGDLFLHAKGATGSHVIVPGGAKKGDPQVLIEAATLAAHFSDRRGEAVVDVQHTDRRHVRKRRGSAVGLVELTQEKVLAVRVEEPLLARLLASEGR